MDTEIVKKYDDMPALKVSGLAKDYTGEVLGRLLIIKPVKRQSSHLYWEAECECGTHVLVRSHQIKNHVVSSCGRCHPHYRKREDLVELPYTSMHHNEQGELVPVEDTPPAPERNIDVLSVIRALDNEPAESAPSATTAWDVAEQCCNLLKDLSREKRIKALNLVRVEMDFE